MPELIALILLTLFALLGVVELCRLIRFYILSPKGSKQTVTIVPVNGHEEKLEYIIRASLARSRWYTSRQLLVIADMGMDAETRMICERLCRDNEEIYCCKAQELNSVLEQLT